MAKLMGRHFKVNGIGILPAFGSLTLFGLDGKLNFLAISVLIIGAFTYRELTNIRQANPIQGWPYSFFKTEEGG